MLDTGASEDLPKELLKLPAGTVKCFLGAGFEGVRRLLESETPDFRRPILLLKRVDSIPTASQLIQDVLHTMATAARNLWPVWFTDVDFGLGISAADRAAVRSRASQLAEQVPGLSAIWVRRAVLKAMEGQPPLLRNFPRATQLHQTRLAISRKGLVLVMALSPTGQRDGSLLSLANAVLWLARNAKLAVAVLLPAEMSEHPALAHILYDPIICASLSANSSEPTAGHEVCAVDETISTAKIWLWLGEGRTHPSSAGEAKLAAALRADTELARLFSANQAVETAYNNRPIVDLFWRQGRVVVEIDGPDHRQPQKYAADRRRDFELLVSGYSVLRVLNEEVMTDTAKVLAQIREVVRYCRRTRSELERLP